MAGAEEVMAAFHRQGGNVYAGLVLNEKGYERAVASGVDEVHYALSATDEFGRRNQNAVTSEGVSTALALVRRGGVEGRAGQGALHGGVRWPIDGPVRAPPPAA